MEIEIVSKTSLVICIIASVLFLGGSIIRSILFPNYLYICNDNQVLDIYKRIDKQDILLSPANIKNTFMCMSRGMNFYDRKIEKIEGTTSKKILSEINKRYIVEQYEDDNKYLFHCEEGKNTILIVQKNIVLNVLNQAIEQCKPDTVILTAKYKENKIIKALESRRYQVIFIDKGEYKKIIM